MVNLPEFSYHCVYARDVFVSINFPPRTLEKTLSSAGFLLAFRVSLYDAHVEATTCRVTDYVT
eukprot:9120451-Pyramimonas_sp.AAC.2